MLVNQAGGQRFVGSVLVGGIGLAVAAGVVFFLAAHLGLALLTTAERVAVFWPASGIAAGALIALGRRARTPVAAGVVGSDCRSQYHGRQKPLGSSCVWPVQCG